MAVEGNIQSLERNVIDCVLYVARLVSGEEGKYFYTGTAEDELKLLSWSDRDEIKATSADRIIKNGYQSIFLP